jgi:lipopolysaccharide/colanic/teichoic acid biosynthesis glycosyltransferase
VTRYRAGEAAVDRSASSRVGRSRAGGISVDIGRRSTVYERTVKPLVDRIAASLLLFLLAPVMMGVALLVRAQLGSGVLYRQHRVGLHGQIFPMLKFRTMEPDRRRDGTGTGRGDRRADERRHHERRTHQVAFAGPDRRAHQERRHAERRTNDDRRHTHKTPADPRHTSLGRFLRRFSLDELPQLFNVLRGELSLVGPRPELPEVVAAYEPWQHARHQVKPGITGLWQVTERSADSLMHLHVATDLRYIERMSATTDLTIMLRTPAAVLGIGRARSGGC